MAFYRIRDSPPHHVDFVLAEVDLWINFPLIHTSFRGDDLCLRRSMLELHGEQFTRQVPIGMPFDIEKGFRLVHLLIHDDEKSHEERESAPVGQELSAQTILD